MSRNYSGGGHRYGGRINFGPFHAYGHLDFGLHGGHVPTYGLFYGPPTYAYGFPPGRVFYPPPPPAMYEPPPSMTYAPPPPPEQQQQQAAPQPPLQEQQQHYPQDGCAGDCYHDRLNKPIAERLAHEHEKAAGHHVDAHIDPALAGDQLDPKGAVGDMVYYVCPNHYKVAWCYSHHKSQGKNDPMTEGVTFYNQDNVTRELNPVHHIEFAANNPQMLAKQRLAMRNIIKADGADGFQRLLLSDGGDEKFNQIARDTELSKPEQHQKLNLAGAKASPMAGKTEDHHDGAKTKLVADQQKKSAFDPKTNVLSV